MDDLIPFIDLGAQRAFITDEIDNAIEGVLKHGRFIMGPEIEELEKALSIHSKAENVIACSSGTDALVLALLALNIGPGSAVFIPAFTFAGTAGAAAILGATPVFVDVEEDTFNMCSKNLKAAINDVQQNSTLTASAVIAVDLFGQPADHLKIKTIAEQNNIKIIIDAAQSYGAQLQGNPSLKFGHISTTSFFPSKPLGCYGDGGAVFTDDAKLANIVRSLRIHGQTNSRYEHLRVGLNARMDTLQAAILLAKLRIFDRETEKRQQIAQIYNENLKDFVTTPVISPDRKSSWSQYTVKTKNRDEMIERLKMAKIPTAVYYPKPLNTQPAFQRFPTAPGGVPISTHLAQQVLSLPIHPYLDRASQDHIIKVISS